MNAYLSYDRIQEERDNAELARNEKDEWVRDKAEEIKSHYPEELGDFKNPFLEMNSYAAGLCGDVAQDAYAKFVNTVCLDKAIRLWEEKEFNDLADAVERQLEEHHKAPEAA